MALMSFDLKLLQVECNLGSNPLPSYFCQQLIAPASVVLLVLGVWIKRRYRTQHVDDFLVESVNSSGTLMKVMFMSVVSSCVLPLICYGHPNGQFSMISSPDMICYTNSTHISMMVIGIVAFMCVALPFWSAVVYASIFYPRFVSGAYSDSGRRLRMFRFVFLKYQPSAYFYGCVVPMRSLVICLVPVVVRDNGPVQVILVGCFVLCCFALQQNIQPWRVRIANLTDGGLSICLVMMLLCTQVGKNSDPGASTAAIGAVATLLLVFLVLLVCIAYIISLHAYFRRSLTYHSFISHHKVDAAAQARYLQLSIQGRVGRRAFLDSDHALNLDVRLNVVSSQVGTVIVLLTSNALRRPWCAGEIVVTH
uniref:TRP C-terminal domain-containing protein n=1 Tax=Zooxanthella nutricula TaxID=1333877 RepID=A0A7S2LN19_9DINO